MEYQVSVRIDSSPSITAGLGNLVGKKKGPEIQQQSEIASDPTVRSPIKRPSNTAVTDMQRVKVSPVQFPG